MKKQKILLLTDVFPCDNYSGALVSAQLCRFLLDSKHSVFCACVHSEEIQEQYDDYLSAKIPRLDFIKPEENSANLEQYDKDIKNIASQIITYIKKEEINILWCPIQGETLLKIFVLIQQKIKGVRYVPQIWDPFSWILHDLNYSEERKKELLTLFDKAMKKCDSIITASRPMGEDYEKKYGVPCHPVFASYQLESIKNNQNKNKDITIVLSGQTYAQKGIQSLLQALDLLKWQIGNKKIVLKYFGSNFQTFSKYKKHVLFGGYMPQSKLVEEQQKAHLLYCSYFFDNPSLDIVSKHSYPSKIITYIPSQVPILIHSEENCPVFKDFNEYGSGYLLNSTDPKIVKAKLEEIFSATKKDTDKLNENAKKLFNRYFTPAQNKKSFFAALDLPYSSEKPVHILEINNLDLPGHVWNGYDIMEHINNDTKNIANQICTYKTSQNSDVIKIYASNTEQELEYKVLDFEKNILSVHSCLSVSSPTLLNKKVYQNADLLHFHLIHNMKLSLFSLIKLCNEKPSVISIHDPWTFTGHCVHFGDCNRYMTGCHNCPYLDAMFPLKHDNSSELWDLKKLVYDKIDVDYVVSTKFMYDLFTNSPLTKGKRVHLIPFGMDINKFRSVGNQEARKKYQIPKDHIVLFHRAQKEFKGTNFFVDALRQLDTNKNITVITCGELGLLDTIKSKYNIIELGNVEDLELSYAYNACDIFVMPSIGESFGMMAVEAMSCAKPVIVFNNTALPSVTFAPKCGIAVENLNSTKLMEAIRHLIDDKKDRDYRGKIARELVEKHYDIKIYNQKIDNLYKEVLARKHNFQKNQNTNQVQETPDSIALKFKLNMLTKKLFPPNSEQYKNLIYDLYDKKYDKNLQIKYGNLNIQLLLDQYNNKMVSLHNDFIKSGYKDPRFHIKILHFAKLFLFLLVHDRKKLIIVTKKRLGIK